jgi:hypothetical protein
MSWLATAAIVVGAIGTGVAVYGQVEAAQTAKKMGEYNAKLAESQAAQIDLDSRESVKRRREQNRRFLGTQRTAYAKSGVTIEGSPLEVMAETAGILELEALDASRQATQQTRALRAQGAYDRQVGSNQARAAYIGAGSSLLSGAGNTAYMGSQLSSSRAAAGQSKSLATARSGSTGSASIRAAGY